VVGFGASAGGLEAFSEVLEHIPEDAGLVFVLVQHLDPKHSSMLTELLARATRMPVRQVKDGMPVEPNYVYVIPPNTNITISNRVLHLEPRSPSGQHLPIDHFFRSLAADQGSKAIGIVLSGTASDGTMGLKAIKAEGGIAFAQEPATARYDGMPRSAIAAGCVDSILSPQGIASELIRLCQHPYISKQRSSDEAAPDSADSDLTEIFSMLRAAMGVDFAQYKPGTIRRRTLRRMALHRFENAHQYVRYLRQNREELNLLFEDILINVTGFFREGATFEALHSSVFPEIMKDRRPEDPIRVWVPGCATGEEAYSAAICLLEYMREARAELTVQIFGTDISDRVLEKARAGIYPESIAADVSPDRLRRFFVRVNSSYQIARSVRDVCVFARQNVTRDPPFSKLDLITCRNVLIYLGPVLQAKVMRLFHYALKPNGFLVLGSSESVGAATDLFTPVGDRQQKIYGRRPVQAAITTDFGAYEEREAPGAGKSHDFVGIIDTHKRVDQMILARYCPPAVVVDGNLRVQQFRGQTGSYLAHPPGEANLSLTKMMRAGIGVEIPTLIRQAQQKEAPVKGDPVRVSVGGELKQVVVSVTHIPGPPEPQYMIVFEESPQSLAPAQPAAVEGANASAERARDLEQELTNTKEYLQSVIEEQEASTEELKSAHEEVQSSNEELQSTNEELLTAKEELQSTNEELTTVNEEMQGRNIELQNVNNDLINLLSSVNIPIIMLGNDLRIRRFTPQAERILNLLSADVGRPISDFRLKINVPDLGAMCQEVMDTLVAREREVEDADHRVYSMWIRPYRTADNRIDGVVLSMFDMTERRQAAEARYRRLFEAAKDGIVIAHAGTGEIVDSNPFVSKLFGYPRGALLGRKFWETDLFKDSEIDASMLSDLHEAESIQKSLTLNAESGEAVEVEIIASAHTEGDKRVVQFNIRDVTARKRLEEKMRRNEEQGRQAQKMEAVGRLAGGVAHDFNNLLTGVLGYCELLGNELEGNAKASDMVAQIRQVADRATALTKQLLAFGRKQVLHPAVIDPNTVVSEMRQLMAVMLHQGIELEIRTQPDVGRVRADRSQLEQVLLNLVLNARDAMPLGGTIIVETARVDVDEAFSERHPAVPAGQYTTLTVKDTGTGMDAETQSHLFEPFYTTKPKGTGVGLGLSTVYGIVKQSGGYIWAYSELGVGSTLSVYLPRVEEELVGGAEQAQAEVAGGTETILLVEDEQIVRELARRFLEKRGYRVMAAANGPEALRISREFNGAIHLLLTDVVMPHMSGREVAFQLAGERPDMKALYMSGHTEDAIIHHGVLQEGVAFLQKPFTDAVLSAKVRAILDSK
jgi:two-component system CheB/CheR fusion protein